ncbi:uncharacterized protein LOC123685307 [Harmonia axyridis]|uniref:uncharacterized protein LOC123685307 n=1 Tax=Harmonia axyridis TaxID=115357 RepID=UPI001E275276|nr:uncharacterized protein LOC123685307 [Harmonia axyridis]
MDQTTLDFCKQAFEQLTKQVQDFKTEINESIKSLRNETEDNCKRMIDNTKRLENTRNEVESKELEDHERNQNNQEVSKMMDATPDRKKERLQMTKARRLKLKEYRAFQEFLKNVCSVKIWLKQKLHIAADESYREPLNLESEIQKNSSFEEEVMDSDERVQSVINEGQELLHSNHYAKDEIVIRLEEIKEDWKRLLELKQIKREKLNEAYQALLFRRSVEEFEVWLGEVEIQVSNDFGKYLASDNNILRCHPALENDYQQHLENYESINEIDEEVQWLSDRKSLAASLDLGISLTAVQSLQKKYRTLEVELNSREHIVKSSMDRAVNMMRSGHEFFNDISEKVKELENRFMMVRDMASLKMLRLQDALESEKFHEESSEAEAWIDDKLLALATSEVVRDEISIQMLQGELSLITAEVEDYQEMIDKLSQRCSNLVEREHYDADNIKKREEEIVQEFKKLRQLVAQREVSLSEAFQYFGFLQECTKLQEWIKDQMTKSKIEKHGVDVEHVELLIHAFDTFYARIMNSEARLHSCLVSGNALIDAECSYSAKIQEKMIEVQTLLELVNGPNELLVRAKQVHMFDRRAEEIISWISEKEVDLCYDTNSQDSESNQDLLRKPLTFEGELEVIEDKANFREQVAKKLVEEFPETNEHIDSKREDTLEAYKYLVVCAERKKYNLQQLEPSRGYINQDIAEKFKILKLGLGTWKKRKDICDQNLDVQLFKKQVSVFVNWLITRDDALKEEKLEDLIGRYCDFEERIKVREKAVRYYSCEQGNCRNGESCRFSHRARYVQGLNILGRGQCNEFASPTPLPLSKRYRKHRELDRKIKTLLERDASGATEAAETKKKGKGQIQYQVYILVYSGVDRHERTKEGVALLVHNKHKLNIDRCQYISSRIIVVTIHMENQKRMNIISVYAPEDNKPKKGRENSPFWDANEAMIVLGDCNARIGSEIIPGIKQRFNEEVINSNGELLINLCALSELRINNTFFHHKAQHKYTFENSRGQRSTIDYILSNRHIHPAQVRDVRTLNSANVNSDHRLLMGKVKLKLPLKRNNKNRKEQKLNVESLWHDSTRVLYQRRLQEKIETNPIDSRDDVDVCWQKLKTNIEEAVNEVLGKRMINMDKGINRTPWFTDEIKKKCSEKKQVYLKYRAQRTPESYEQYKTIRNETNSLIRSAKNSHWEKFSKRMESDFYGLQKQMWRLIRTQRKEINELTEPKHISKETWTKYLETLYKKEEDNIERNNTPAIVTSDSVSVENTDVELALRQLRNRKSPGLDGIPNELLKYGGQHLVEQLTLLTKAIFYHHRIPEQWRTSIAVLMFKKGDKKKPENYRGINLLSTTLKLITKIITNKINNIIFLSDEQQGFRSGRSCKDAVFVMRQIVEKSIQYNRPAYMCFVDLQKAFDRVQIQDVVHLLYQSQIPHNLIKVIEDIYSSNKIQAKIDGELTRPIPI